MDVFVFIDTKVFLAINHLPHTVFFDTLARGLSGIGQWGIIWLFVAIFLFYREEVRDRLFFISFISAGVCSVASELILKWMIARPRPNVHMGAIILDTPGNYSFPSTHTTLAFAFSYLLMKIEPRGTVIFLILATIISISRIYLGVHYPSDVIAGAMLGTLFGKVSLYIESKARGY